MHEKNINRQIKRTAKDSLYYLPTKIIPAIVGIILIRILTTIFTPAEYGSYQITLATFGLLRIFSVMWLSSSTMRFYLPAIKEEKESVFLSTVFLGALAGALLLALTSFLVNWGIFRHRIDGGLYHLINIAISASIFTAFFEIYVVAFRARLQPQKYALYWLFYAVGKPLLGLLLILILNFRVDGIFLAFVIVPLILDVFLFREFSLFRALKSSKPDKQLMSQLFKYGSQISVSFLAFWILSFSDRYLIEIFASTDQVGYYSVGYAVSEKTLNFLYTILMLAAYPIIIDNWDKQGKEYTIQLITELVKYFFIFCAPILTVLLVMPEKVLSLFASEKFVPGAQVLPLIAIGIFINGLSQYVIKGFELHKKTRYIAVLALSVGAVNVGLNVILIPRFGILGAGISSCFSYVLYFLFANIGTRSFMVFRPPWRTIGIVALAASTFALELWIGSLCTQKMFWLFLFIVPAGAAAYFLILYLLGEINASVCKVIKGTVR